MLLSQKSKTVIVSVLALALVGVGASSASAAPSPASTGPLYVLDDNAVLIPQDQFRDWDQFMIGNPNTSGDGAPFMGSADATAVKVFLATPGQELDIQAWKGVNDTGFAPNTLEVSYPNISLFKLVGTAMGNVKSTGGTFSLGIAYTKGNGVQIAEAGVVFSTLTIKPGGSWSYKLTGGGVVPPATPSQTAEINLEATTVTAVDGALALSVPANAKATFGTATLVDGKSTSTATLPEFSVKDDRVVSKPGWTLTQSTADFTNGSAIIDAKNLGVKAKLNATGTTSTAVTAGAEQVAGSARKDGALFADAVAGAGNGVTTLSADLKLVAPADAPAGTYTSKMTLTLVSK